MLYVVMIFLWTAILLYLLLGGADFGAGIIELFTSDPNKSKIRKTMYRAIGPVWEANHMWLIITIVILFVGFPSIYTTMSVYIHIPLVLMLLGIIARGTAFTFRHYDAVKDEMQQVYNKIFVYSSFITPFFLGIIAGSTVARRIDTEATNFLDAYIFSWFHWFSIAVGLFTVAICGFLAAVFIIGQIEDRQERERFVRKAKTFNIAAVFCGGLVFMASLYEKIPLLDWVFGNPVGITTFGLATISVIFLWRLWDTDKTNLMRLLAGFQITMILLITTWKHYPNIILLKNGNSLSLLEEQGNAKTIDALGWALLLGSLFILPALICLIYSFQKPKEKVKRQFEN
ncbi:cytochrome D ubiquinol oxidase subunit II [Pedobacter psychrophilus]|uniref:Cytochrome D ubiquinol oxidase subunit II n=1 Tax=Pedobacter psychrophilus TaxID=1826909 RepID=A0A179DG24_9SPHI|nr:cytochrome d ubiquinol oxidase subunit II [Pedobacter psychrophilus]OAQ39908.1 cytochrome D ubiquinol oxidase subunit II [Pedobacter psychrophilus]